MVLLMKAMKLKKGGAMKAAKPKPKPPSKAPPKAVKQKRGRSPSLDDPCEDPTSDPAPSGALMKRLQEIKAEKAALKSGEPSSRIDHLKKGFADNLKRESPIGLRMSASIHLMKQTKV